MADMTVPPAQPAPQLGPQPTQDLSSKTITVLVLLTLVVSFIGTFVSLTQLSALSSDEPAPKDAASVGKVQFVIAPPEPPATDAATGLVTLKIAQP